MNKKLFKVLFVVLSLHIFSYIAIYFVKNYYPTTTKWQPKNIQFLLVDHKYYFPKTNRVSFLSSNGIYHPETIFQKCKTNDVENVLIVYPKGIAIGLISKLENNKNIFSTMIYEASGIGGVNDYTETYQVMPKEIFLTEFEKFCKNNFKI